MKKKLIEVALPLEAINKEAAREKSIRHGHPSTLHLWWARRPLAACRAVLFASLVDDPSSHPDDFPTEADQDRERQRLFRLIEALVKWDNSKNEQLLEAARQEILKSTDGHPPPICDPFCGGGSIPLEAQRLGLDSHASDLNPVAVLITKALIEIPPRFAGQPPVHPMPQGRMSGTGMWQGARGLAEDVRYYGQWMHDRAAERIGHLYPKVKLPNDQGGCDATVVAWLWARTVQCPSPACGATMPLVKSFALSTKRTGKVWLEPRVDHTTKVVSFDVKSGQGTPPLPPKTGRGAKFRCLVCQQIAPDQHIKDEGFAGRMGQELLAIVAEGPRGRIYLPASEEHRAIAASAVPGWAPEEELAHDPRALWCIPYGLRRFRDLFTRRQLVALTTFADLIADVRRKVIVDGGSEDYGKAIATYLAFALSKMADRGSTICTWFTERDSTRNTFARQAIPMTWDFAELNTLLDGTGSFSGAVEWTAESLDGVPARSSVSSEVTQIDATSPFLRRTAVFSTDPPYYDNIGYADLSDFFYVWLRRSLGNIYPDIFSTLLVPKKQELVATPYRFDGSKEKAQRFFEDGFSKAFGQMRQAQHPDFPLTVYYAFKQSESDSEEKDEFMPMLVSTGWETMLEGLVRADFQVTGTWPMRSELTNRPTASGTNALASCIVLACRPRVESASVTTRKDLIASLKNELPAALHNLQKGNIAPVDLAQAAIGPGMAVFSRYRKVLESDGSAMRVRTALGLINQTLDEVLSEQEGEFDPDTRWALAWFEQHAFDEGPYGEAEVLATAKALSVSALDETKILHSRAGKVRLLRRDELATDWNPSAEHRLTVWAVTQHLIRSLDKNGETATAALASKVGGLAETARDLAYRLYILSERKGWAEEAGYYNSLVVAWPAIAPKAFALS